MRKVTFVLVLMLTAASSPAIGQSTSSIDNGRVTFNMWCAPCHAAVGPKEYPGTAALRIKYNGAIPAVLEQRNDLVPAFIRVVVRGGLFGMPMTRKTEISDAELEDVIAYLTRNNN